jgi:hypothetical protein
MIFVLLLLSVLAAAAIARAATAIARDGYGGDAHLPRSHDNDTGAVRLS